jgi:hypothetical protein
MALMYSPVYLLKCGRILAAFVFLSTLLACNQKALEGHGLLPPAPADQTTSAVPPPSPFDQTLGNAGFTRTVLHTAGPANIDVTVRDAIVGPRAEAQLPAAAGPILIDLRSGAGSAIANGKTLDLSSQEPASLPAGVTITLKNGGNTPLVVRLYFLEGK